LKSQICFVRANRKSAGRSKIGAKQTANAGGHGTAVHPIGRRAQLRISPVHFKMLTKALQKRLLITYFVSIG
jgi:hypothetical protein